MVRNLDIDWKDALEKLDTIDDKWRFFKQKMEEATAAFIPLKRSGGKHKGSIPFSPNLLKKIRKKHRAWQRFLETKSGEKYQEFCKLRNQVRKLTRLSEIQYEKGIADEAKTNPKKFWKYVKGRTKTRPGVPNFYKQPDLGNKSELTSSEEEKAEILVNYFTSVFTVENPIEMPNIIKHSEASIGEIEFTKPDLNKRLHKLNVSKSPGPDQLHPRILRECANIIDEPLTILFKESYRTGTLPEEWKLAMVSAIHKKGDKTQPSNYRPVSLTCITCKLIEGIIRDHTMDHM